MFVIEALVERHTLQRLRRFRLVALRPLSVSKLDASSGLPRFAHGLSVASIAMFILTKYNLKALRSTQAAEALICLAYKLY